MDPVRRQAVQPWDSLPVPPEIELVPLEGATVGFSPWPMAQMIKVDGTGPADVQATVEAARAVARERGKAILAWWIAAEHDHLVPALEACGIVNEDPPGFEAVENAMVLVQAPAGRSDPAVEVRMSETWEDFLAGHEVVKAAFGLPDQSEEELRANFELSRRGPGRGFLARLDGRPVGSSFSAPGEAGVNLFGGAVAEDARGRGVYRAMVQARWDWAVELGTPALTVQAGRMSRPILEHLGFEFVEPVRVFVDVL